MAEPLETALDITQIACPEYRGISHIFTDQRPGRCPHCGVSLADYTYDDLRVSDMLLSLHIDPLTAQVDAKIVY
jgi:hypothetical protein